MDAIEDKKFEEIEEKFIKEQQSKKKKNTKISGKSVFNLQKIIKDKNNVKKESK